MVSCVAPGVPPLNQALNMRGDDPAGVIGRHVIAKRDELGGHDVVATGRNRTAKHTSLRN